MNLKISKFPRATISSRSPLTLIEPDDLIALQNNSEEAKNFILLEAHFSSVDHPLDHDTHVFRHIPGAIQIHPSYLEAGLNHEKYYPNYDHPDESNMMLQPELTVALENIGIFPESTVVVYGSDPDGVMAAARLVWGLMVAGIKEIRLLDGGIDAWVSHGHEPSLTVKNVWDLKREPHNREAINWNFRPEFVAEMNEVQKLARDGSNGEIGKLIDVRTDGEWNGSTPNKYSFFKRAGHIPGAIHQGDWPNLMHGSSKSLGRYLEIVEARWQKEGIIDKSVENHSTPLTFYCGTGWRSSIAFLVGHLLGFRVRNFEAGFFGWSHLPENPVEH